MQNQNSVTDYSTFSTFRKSLSKIFAKLKKNLSFPNTFPITWLISPFHHPPVFDSSSYGLHRTVFHHISLSRRLIFYSLLPYSLLSSPICSLQCTSFPAHFTMILFHHSSGSSSFFSSIVSFQKPYLFLSSISSQQLNPEMQRIIWGR